MIGFHSSISLIMSTKEVIDMPLNESSGFTFTPNSKITFPINQSDAVPF